MSQPRPVAAPPFVPSLVPAPSEEDLVHNLLGEASKLLALTGNSLAVRQLRKLRDVVRRAVGEHVSSRPTTIVRMWLTPRSIFDIAVELGQDPLALIDVNPGLDNLLMIPARTPVLVFNG